MKVNSKFKILRIIVIASVIICSTVSYSFSQSFTGGEISTYEAYNYGKFQALIKTDWGSGLINAMFLYKEGSQNAGVYWKEVDWEILGKNTKEVTFDIHYAHGDQNHPYMKDRWIWGGRGSVNHNQYLDQGFYWYTTEVSPTSISRYIHTGDWRSNVFYHHINLNNVCVNWNGNKCINQTEWNNAGSMNLRFNLWAFNEPTWSGAIDWNVLSGGRTMKISEAAYYAWNGSGFNAGATWYDNFNTFNTGRWNKNYTHTLGDTRLSPNNVVHYPQYGEVWINLWRSSSARLADPEKATAEISSGDDVKIFPNPFQNSAVLNSKDLSKVDKINVYDAISGSRVKVINHLQSNTNEISIGDDLPKGSYVVVLKKGDKTEVVKVIKN
ncbi:MAG TPA: family 16 glycosylhydrolase [Cytophagales bacterium]|nr:family 16 glycosylhydrolase [Cytophagales bacterium]